MYRLTFIIEPWLEVTRGQGKRPVLAAPLDALIATDPELAAGGIYPAIGVEVSGSNAPVSKEQEALQNAVRAQAAAPRVRAFMSQPFFVVQHETGMRGVEVLQRETLHGFSRIIAGEVDEPAHALKYRGALPSPTC